MGPAAHHGHRVHVLFDGLRQVRGLGRHRPVRPDATRSSRASTSGSSRATARTRRCGRTRSRCSRTTPRACSSKGLFRAPILSGPGLKAGLETIRFMPSTTGGARTHIACSPYEHGMFRGDWLLYGRVARRQARVRRPLRTLGVTRWRRHELTTPTATRSSRSTVTRAPTLLDVQAVPRVALARRVRRVGRRVREPVRRPARADRVPQLGQRAPARGDRVAGRRRRGAVPEHRPAVLRAGQPHRARTDRRRLRAPLGRAAGAQPLARRLLRGRARPARRLRAGVPQRPRRHARRGPLGEGATCDVFGGVLLPNVAAQLARSRRCGIRTTSRCGSCARSSTSSCNIHAGSGLPDFGDARGGAGDHAHRARVVRAPRGVAPHLRRRARAPPEPARRAHRAGHELDPARARHARLVPPPHDARRRGRSRVLRRGRRRACR